MASRLDKLSAQLAGAPAAHAVGLEGAACAAQQVGVFGKVGSKGADDVVIVSALRTPIAKARKGFNTAKPDDLLVAVFEGVLKQSGIKPELIDDVVVGNVQTVGAFSMPSRAAMFRAGIPDRASVRAVNRQCSSGLQAVASIAADIKAGFIEVGIGAGVESMTNGGNPSDPSSLPPMNLNEIFSNPGAAACLTPMGITSENVAEKHGVTRQRQDQLAVDSHAKALRAQKAGLFKAEIVPVKTTVEVNGEEKEVVVSEDEGPRAGTTLEGLAKLKPAFKKDGSTTAGNASQVSDGAAAVLLMKRSKAKQLGLPVIGTFRGFKVAGCDPLFMGEGPAYAIPALLQDVGLQVKDIDVFELNEAFASQALFCIDKLGLPMAKVNPRGGAISLGHPLGATGARMVATLLSELKHDKKKLGVISMCIGTGMGAAALIEADH